jgi:hippurate hydrolase
VDPVVIAAQIVLALQTIASREIDPLDGVVVTVGAIHGGSAPNIIPDSVKLQLTVRSYTPAVREKTLASIRRISRFVAVAGGVPADRLPEVQLRDEFTPAVYNDPELCRRAAAVFRAALGQDRVESRRAEMIGEDFGAYRLQDPPIPSLMFRVGTSDPYRTPGTTPAPLHSGHYTAAVEPSIRTGATAMAALALELLKR